MTYWTERSGVSAEELRKVVAKIGSRSQDVALALGKPYPPD